ncbi:MAG TPA: MFS transporter, partial [Casimicrobiaceae bacterium]|nr:MFS transporter [Casimicrobiaceae bacterium]
MTPQRLAWVALATTLGIQVYTAMTSTVTAVLAPLIAPDLHIAPRWVGAFIGLVYLGAMVASLTCGAFIERYGPIRVSQSAALLCGFGVMLMTFAQPSMLALMVIAPIVMGLGYGPITPASSQLLARTAPPERMALTFSIKQTGVPAGAALAGALMPALGTWLGWRGAFLVVAAFAVVVFVSAQPIRGALDADRQSTRRVSLRSSFTQLALIRRTPALLELSLIGMTYSATQVSLMSFLVVYLNESLGFGLVAAGLGLSATTLGGVFGRIAWGAVADRAQAPQRVLGWIGLAASACGTITAAAQAAWSFGAIIAIVSVFGATAI